LKYDISNNFKNLNDSWTTYLKKLIVPQLVQKCHAFYAARRFITVFTADRHCLLSLPM
jgi:hypothetical protein